MKGNDEGDGPKQMMAKMADHYNGRMFRAKDHMSIAYDHFAATSMSDLMINEMLGSWSAVITRLCVVLNDVCLHVVHGRFMHRGMNDESCMRSMIIKQDHLWLGQGECTIRSPIARHNSHMVNTKRSQPSQRRVCAINAAVAQMDRSFMTERRTIANDNVAQIDQCSTGQCHDQWKLALR